MNELEQLRDQLIGMRAQINSALKSIERLMQAIAEPEPETPQRPRYLGDSEPAE